jgi:hypothetical protein
VRGRGGLLAAALALLPLAAHAGDTVFPTAAEKQNARLLDPKHVSERTKAYLKTKMKNHGADARQLATDVALLQWEKVKKHANEIAVQPRVDRSAAGKVGAIELSDAFFELQDLLRTRASELEASADRKDPKATAAAFGAMLDTCATCHSVYLTPPEKPAVR